LNIDAGLNDTGVVYFIIDDGTQTIFPEVAANDTSSSTDKATTESEKPATAIVSYFRPTDRDRCLIRILKWDGV